jgi:glyceraldehyde 3-phosphate dehydrogenase
LCLIAASILSTFGNVSLMHTINTFVLTSFFASAFNSMIKRDTRTSALNAYSMGVNGFGRIGRLVTRVMIENPDCNLVAINSGRADPDYMAYQFKYDSTHGKWKGTIEVDKNDLIINGKRVHTTKTKDPLAINWGKLGVDYVCESTGVFLTAEAAKVHIDSGAKKVVFSAPAKDDTHTVVMGVNQDTYTPNMRFVSCASCTTNGLAPLVKIIDDAYGMEEALMSTVHAMTATQLVVDGTSNKDWRGGRAASANIIPSSTGAAKAVAAVIPHLKGKITGMAFRVPTIDVSVVDLTCRLKKPTSMSEIASLIKSKSSGDLKGIMGYSDEALVSQDFVSSPLSSIFDKEASIMLNPHFVKLIAWYDNEFGYSNRVVDLMGKYCVGNYFPFYF